MSVGLRERITAKLAERGMDDLLAMLWGITAQDTAGLSAEVDHLAAQLLAHAQESLALRLPREEDTRARTLAKAARILRPNVQPAEVCTLCAMEPDFVDEVILADLVGLGHQIAAVAAVRSESEAARLLRLSGQLMLAAAVVMESLATEESIDPEAEPPCGERAWWRLATAEGSLRRTEALVTEALAGQSLGLPKDEDDRWATAAVILSRGLPPVADALREERGSYREALQDVDPRGWVRLIATTLQECAAEVAPALDTAPSSGLKLLVSAARSWAQVAAAEDGTAAIARASTAGVERADG